MQIVESVTIDGMSANNGKISTDGTKHRTINVRFRLEGEDKQIRCVCVYVKDENVVKE